MAEQEVVKHTKAVYKAWNNPQTSWKHKAKEILVEILIIVFAVSLSIWLHGWSEHKHEQKIANDFLSGLRNDLKADIHEIESPDGDIYAYRTLIDGVQYYQRVIAGEPYNKDSANFYIWTLFNTTQLVPNISRFEGFKSSGQLGFIENKELMNSILDLYQEDIPQLINLTQTFNQYKRAETGRYLDTHLFTGKDGNNNLEAVIKDPVMNNYLQRGFAAYGIINQYDSVVKKSTLIIKQIDKELE